jgi:HemY protein
MRSFIVFLLVFIISICVGLKIAQDPGYAFFSYQNWSVEMPLWFAVFTFLLVLLVGYILVRLFDSVDFSLYRLRNWMRYRQKTKSYSKTNKGLLELIEGNWQTAEKYLLEGIPQSDAPLINYLAAAKAAQQLGSFDKRDAYLRKAHDIAPHAEIAIGLTQAQLLYEQGQLEQALATLGHLRVVAPKQKHVLKLMERIYTRLGDWQELLKLLPSLRKARLIDATEMEIFEKNIYLQVLQTQKSDNAESLRATWNSIPRKFQKDPLLICAYVELMLPYPDAATESESLLTKILKTEWNENAARLYGLIVGSNPAKQLARAEEWSRQYPSQPILYLTLGRLSVRNQLWGKARDYYESSLKLAARPETYIDYAKLLETLEDPSSAIKNYRDGLLLAASPGNA